MFYVLCVVILRVCPHKYSEIVKLKGQEAGGNSKPDQGEAGEKTDECEGGKKETKNSGS